MEKKLIFNSNLIPCNATIVVGLSGGADSVCLLHKLTTLQKHHNIKLIAAHFDHEWSKSSKFAVKASQDLANKLEVEFVTQSSSQLNFKPKWNGSKEEQARLLRMHFLQATAQQHNASAIALAHHAQDQEETFFIRLLRGTSLTGLTGIKEHNGMIIRPLLQTSKASITTYLAEHSISYYDDPSNESDDFLRNRIRHHVIPSLEQADQRFHTTFHNTLSKLQAAEDFLHTLSEQTLNSIYTDDGIDTAAFCKLHIALQHRVLMLHMIKHGVTISASDKFFKECVRFLHNNKTNKHLVHKNWILKKHKNRFQFIKK